MYWSIDIVVHVCASETYMHMHCLSAPLSQKECIDFILLSLYLLSMPSEVKSGGPYSLIVNYHSALIINYKTKLENPHISKILSP